MNQANVSKLVSKLRYRPRPEARRLKNIEGPIGRVKKIQKTLTALIKYERLEVNYHRGDEVRGYAERLISEAIRHGPAHKETMEMADYWIREKQYVHKLFKVLVPRYQDYTNAYTKMYKAARDETGAWPTRSILELKGNPYPPLQTDNPFEMKLLHNQLLDEAKKQYNLTKSQELTERLNAEVEKNSTNQESQ